MEFVRRFFHILRKSFFLFGPRGAGKSTFVSQSFPEAVYLDLLDPERVRTLSANPERLKEIVKAHGEPRYVLIDEIQRVPDLLMVVHSPMRTKLGSDIIK